MNIKKITKRTQSHSQKRSFFIQEKKQISIPKSQCQKSNLLKQSNDDVNEFFDKFHENFVVLELVAKQKNQMQKNKKIQFSQTKYKQCNIQNDKKIRNKKQMKSFINVNQSKKSQKTQEKSLMQRNNKISQSQRNVIKFQKNLIDIKKRSQKKNNAYSKNKIVEQNSKKNVIKKKMNATESTTTTTLGNSGINLKEDIHIASYLRIKLKGN